MSKEGRERCLDAIGLVLTTLPPRRRRRLHYLVRFMHKVTLNHCLKLDPVRNHENRYTVSLIDVIKNGWMEKMFLAANRRVGIIRVIGAFHSEKSSKRNCVLHRYWKRFRRASLRLRTS